MVISRVLCRCALVVVFVASFASFHPVGAQQRIGAQRYVPGELIVQFRPGVDGTQRAAVRASHNASVIREYATLRMERVSIPAAADPIVLARAFTVEAAQPNFIRQTVSAASPNDPYYIGGYLWGLEKISAPSAWSAFGAGNETIVVADIDTGVDYTHPDLAANMWTNPGEIAGNGGRRSERVRRRRTRHRRTP